MNWTTVALGECVAELRGGASIKGDQFTDSGFPVLHKGTIREGGILVFDRDENSHVPTEFAAAKQNAVVDSGFVVATFRNLVRTGETLGFMAPVPDKGKFLLAQGAYGLRLDESRLDKRFLAHLSNAWVFHKEVLKRMVGTTQVHIRNGEFLKIPIPLPPVDEQKRIATILDAADALRSKRRESLAQLDTLLQSTFLDMFGDPVSNAMGWEAANVGDEISFLTSGSRGWAKYYTECGDTFIRIQNLKNGRLDLDDIAFVNAPESAESKRTKVEPGDVLLSITADLGRTAVVPDDIGNAHINQHLAILRFTDLNPVFVSYQLASAGGQAQFARLNREGVKAGLNFNDVRSIRLTKPPLDLQNCFARIVESVEQQKTTQRTHLDELDSLFASLQSSAFRERL